MNTNTDVPRVLRPGDARALSGKSLGIACLWHPSRSIIPWPNLGRHLPPSSLHPPLFLYVCICPSAPHCRFWCDHLYVALILLRTSRPARQRTSTVVFSAQVVFVGSLPLYILPSTDSKTPSSLSWTDLPSPQQSQCLPLFARWHGPGYAIPRIRTLVLALSGKLLVSRFLFRLYLFCSDAC
ncbi:uncharacterized protein FOMMEDRAFT_158917 [Fomitiporia mediterranea MF3/22]|uniref:uncharacterized protein n=1 Tax=Fomitiporia mediterranea (strain MF3/22) TaxID=694068 RepID=UPI0004407E2C|nr:uncharacterized protein FOMMEDRAFT_158917 [Fomitiporia mediterranea MF3/22]EJD01757.1 hypothetical protein FOMMEDRAFT_158917 [Fomitiporia mediterranea MF3/22]